MQRKADSLDKHIGLRLKMRRILMNYTQDDLAKKLGITFQQIQKYEKATNRICASRLWEISNILEIDIVYFFEGYHGQTTAVCETPLPSQDQTSVIKNNILSTHDIIAELLNMSSGEAKKEIFDLLREKLSKKKEKEIA